MDIEDLSATEVANLITRLGRDYVPYEREFWLKQIDGESLRYLNKKDLERKLGIVQSEHQIRILNVVDEIRKKGEIKKPGRVCLNDQIVLTDGRFGVVHFIGETEFGEGIYYGLEMEPKEGKSDGSVQGINYFHTDIKRASFVRLDDIAAITRAATRSFSVGDPVLVRNLSILLKTEELIGEIRYCGELMWTSQHESKHFGVSLIEPKGDHDGTKFGRTYFFCEQYHGVFVTNDQISHCYAEYDMNFRRIGRDYYDIVVKGGGTLAFIHQQTNPNLQQPDDDDEDDDYIEETMENGSGTRSTLDDFEESDESDLDIQQPRNKLSERQLTNENEVNSELNSILDKYGGVDDRKTKSTFKRKQRSKRRIKSSSSKLSVHEKQSQDYLSKLEQRSNSTGSFQNDLEADYHTQRALTRLSDRSDDFRNTFLPGVNKDPFAEREKQRRMKKIKKYTHKREVTIEIEYGEWTQSSTHRWKQCRVFLRTSDGSTSRKISITAMPDRPSILTARLEKPGTVSRSKRELVEKKRFFTSKDRITLYCKGYGMGYLIAEPYSNSFSSKRVKSAFKVPQKLPRQPFAAPIAGALCHTQCPVPKQSFQTLDKGNTRIYPDLTHRVVQAYDEVVYLQTRQKNQLLNAAFYYETDPDKYQVVLDFYERMGWQVEAEGQFSDDEDDSFTDDSSQYEEQFIDPEDPTPGGPTTTGGGPNPNYPNVKYGQFLDDEDDEEIDHFQTNGKNSSLQDRIFEKIDDYDKDPEEKQLEPLNSGTTSSGPPPDYRKQFKSLKNYENSLEQTDSGVTGNSGHSLEQVRSIGQVDSISEFRKKEIAPESSSSYMNGNTSLTTRYLWLEPNKDAQELNSDGSVKQRKTNTTAVTTTTNSNKMYQTYPTTTISPSKPKEKDIFSILDKPIIPEENKTSENGVNTSYSSSRYNYKSKESSSPSSSPSNREKAPEISKNYVRKYENGTSVSTSTSHSVSKPITSYSQKRYTETDENGTKRTVVTQTREIRQVERHVERQIERQTDYETKEPLESYNEEDEEEPYEDEYKEEVRNDDDDEDEYYEDEIDEINGQTNGKLEEEYYDDDEYYEDVAEEEEEEEEEDDDEIDEEELAKLSPRKVHEHALKSTKKDTKALKGMSMDEIRSRIAGYGKK